MSFLDVLLYPIRNVFYGGVTLPQEPTLAFSGTGVTVTDSPSTKQTLINISGGGGSSGISAPVVWSYADGAVYNYPSGVGVNTSVCFDTTGGAIAAILDASPTNGETQSAKDIGLALGTHTLTVSSDGANIEYPPGTISTGPLVFDGTDEGIGLTWQWIGSKNTWFFIG